ncbi:MAG: helix-turn-helix transcriptional regulator [Propionibacteriales bacterium]|nr:helix-turn-helix transcriptional regulator [Propionibacteriales bacterium]
MTQPRLTAAVEMTALAHPLRLDLLELLLTNGAMTASQAGRALSQNPSNVSWHLHKLADHGFVRQAERGPGRERPWKIVAESLAWGDDISDGVQAAALRDVVVDREVQVLRTALAARATSSKEWQGATTLTQARVWLTSEEAKELGVYISAYIASVADRFVDPPLRPEGVRLMAVVSWIVPARPESPPGSA